MTEASAPAVDRFLSDEGARDALPRKNGELVFDEPWESRAFGIAVTLGKENVIEWEDFRQSLIGEIGAWEERHRGTDGSVDSSEWSYYERWLASLERVLLDRNLLTESEIEARAARLAEEQAHEHEHDHVEVA